MSPLQDRPKPERVEAAAWSAIRAIPPAWPLEATVAVNPYLGQAGLDLAAAGARLARTWGAATTMPAAWYEARIARGEILEADLLAALADAPGAIRRLAPAGLVAAARDAAPPTALATVAELAAEVSGVDWPSILQDRMTAWAAGWFDEGQALWRAPRGASAFASWRLTATHDLTPEILGLAGFAAHVANAPDTPLKAIERAVAALGLSEAALELYFHRALASLGGWSQLARQKLWQAELAGGSDETALALLAARLVWDEALHRLYAEDLAQAWPAARARFAEPVVPTAGETALAVLQTAYERAVQRRLLPRLGQPAAAKATSARPALQAAFCIDVRSEVFRRALESLDDRIETLGFAGFFGLGVEHRRFASDVPERRLPVLLNPAVHTTAAPAAGTADWKARIAARGARAWGRFKLAAVSSFAFVEASGPFYAAKLLADSLGLHGPHDSEEPAPRLLDDLSAEARTQAAETILRAMSLTETFAPLVLLVGHGAQVTNNPHASALHCGACGGYPGEVNARLLAGLLNEPAVRAGLTLRGIRVPEDTRFVAALHDTTSDRVELFAADVGLASLESDRAKAWLEAAGRLARAERARRLPGARDGDSVLRRGGDWAEVRPEWALAGCQAFVAAPRAASAGADLGGRVFLHDYAWRRDSGFKVLELILTAPVVVASWISLQYYGSTVSPAMYGAGNKLLHNVVGGIGVLEGGTGPLRVGLPRQSVHDGEAFVHDPVRLSVCIAAPREAIAEILRRHEGVRVLFDNGWLSLFVLNDRGQAVARYRPGLTWEPLEIAAPPSAGERAAA